MSREDEYRKEESVSRCLSRYRTPVSVSVRRFTFAEISTKGHSRHFIKLWNCILLAKKVNVTITGALSNDNISTFSIAFNFQVVSFLM